jgi:hypothetical protein
VMATADLLVLVLRVLPGEIREWLNAEHNLREAGKWRSGTPGQGRKLAGGVCSLRGKGVRKWLKGGDIQTLAPFGPRSRIPQKGKTGTF